MKNSPRPQKKHAKVLIVVLIVLASACHRGGRPVTQSDLDRAASKQAANDLNACAIAYAAAHLHTTLTGTELSIAAASDCGNFANEVYRLYYRAYINDEYDTPDNLPAHADQIASELRRLAIEDARTSVLRMLAEGTESPAVRP